MKSSRETIQYLPYFWKKNNTNSFVIVDADIDQGIHRKKFKVARSEKRKKNYLGFLIQKIWQILTCFSGTFRRAQTLKLLGVM